MSKTKGTTPVDKNGVAQWDIITEAGFHQFEVVYIKGVNSVAAIALNPKEQHLLTPDKLEKLTYLDGIDWPTSVRYNIVGDMDNALVFGQQTRYCQAPVIYRGLVCIDGPDATGKTTLANEIVKMTNGEAIHLTWTPQLAEIMNRYRCSAIEYAAALAHDRVVVLERPWLCNLVYSTVYRDGDYKYHDVLRWKNLCEANEVLSIITIPSDVSEAVDLYSKMCGEREELHGPDREKMLAVHELFTNVVAGVHLPFQPANHPLAKFEIYDYQAYNNDVKDFVINMVLPNLNTWS